MIVKSLQSGLQRSSLVLVAVCVFVLFSAIGTKNLYFNGDYQIFFETNDPQRVAFEEMQGIFSKNDTANIVVAPDDNDVFSQDTLELIQAMTDALWQTPMSLRVDSITNYQHTWSEEDDLVVEDLVPEDMASDVAVRERARTVSTSEPNLVNRLISEDGSVSMIAVTVNLPDGDKTLEIQQIAEFVKSTAADLTSQYPGHQVFFTGVVYMNDAFAGEAKRDSQTLVPAMFGVILLVLMLMLRSVSAMFATTLVIVATIAATIGLGGWTGFFLSTTTVNVPTLVMTLAVADCVHIIVSMLYEMEQGKDKRSAIARSIELNFLPILITSVTTAIGFLTLNFANVPALQDLGNLTALGIIIAFILSVTMLPALLNVLPLRQVSQKQERQSFMDGLATWVIERHKAILAISVVAVALSLISTSNNQINDVATEYFAKTSFFRQSTDFQEQKLSGMATIDFALFSGAESGINAPEVLFMVAAFSDWLKTQPEVDHVSTITDTFKRLNRNMHSDDQEYYRLPDERELAAQYLLLYELSLPYGLDLNNQLDLKKSSTRLTVTMQNLGSREFTAFEQRALTWLENNAKPLEVTTGSVSLMFAHIGEKNMESMLKGTVLALLLISGLLVVALRSFKLGLISLVPNLLPAAIGFGIWGIYSGDVNMGLSVVLSMSLGIIVDDTVHFLSKYQVARKDGNTAEQAIRYAFKSVGKALWTTTVVLTLGFAVLTFSTFAMNADMGMLTAIIILAALVVDFLVLPALLLVFDKTGSQQENSNAHAAPNSP